uniref:hypothetical protein n=1 Tax=Nocardia suismassiliense TaxID=2077092 RepID=UPI003F499F93
MTAISDPVIEVTLLSRTEAQAGDDVITAGKAGIRAAVEAYAREQARRSGRAVQVVVTGPSGKQQTLTVGRRPEDSPPLAGSPLPRRPILPLGTETGRNDPEARNGLSKPLRGIRGQKSAGLRESAGVSAAAGWRDSRVVRYGALSAAIVAAFLVGANCGGDPDDAGSVGAPDRPLDIFSGAGPGDLTSGPGVIEASAYAYYVWPRRAAAVADLWTPGAAGPLDQLQGLIDKAATDKLQHYLEITATRDPLTYDVRLTLTTADRAKHPYLQRFRLTRAEDGTYRIAEKTDCGDTCPPL